jgi:vitamin B12 transporter
MRYRILFYCVTVAVSFSPVLSLADGYMDDLKPLSARPPVIVESPKRYPTVRDRAAENLVVLTAEDLRKLPARDLGEALAYMPGVNVKVTNQLGQPTSLSIQGSQSRQVLVMVDGIPFNTQLSGQANPTRIPVENIERIEVIKGASSSAWGSSLGGVINVITKDVGNSTVPHGRLTSSFGEFATTKNSLELDGGAGKLGYYAFGSYFDTDGIRPEADVEDNKMFGKASYPLNDEVKLTGSFGYSGTDTADLYKDPSLGWVRDTRDAYARYGQIQLSGERPLLNWNAAVKYNKQDIATDLDFLNFSLLTPTISRDVYYGVTLNGTYQARDEDVLAFGTDFSWNEFKTNSAFGKSKSLTTQAPYANYTLHIDQLDIIPGLRYDHNQQFGSQTSPSLGTVYHFDNPQHTNVRLKASRAFNAPPLLWIYQSSSSTLPNPDLEAEKGVVYEAGLETGLTSRLYTDLSVYWADIKDAISSVRISGKTKKVNFDHFQRRGAEAMLNYYLNDEWMVYANSGFNDVRDQMTNDIVRDQGIARTSFGMGLDYQNKKGTGCHLAGHYDRWASSPGLEPNDRKFIFDLKVTQKVADLSNNVEVETFLNVHNLTNSKYWSSITFPLPERYFEGGFSVNF